MQHFRARLSLTSALGLILWLAVSAAPAAAGNSNVFYELVHAAQTWQDKNLGICGHDTKTCGVQKMLQQFQACQAFRIVNGCPIGDQNVYGWQVAVTLGGALCSGTLVSPTHVVCAGHCVDGLFSPDDANQISVYIGPKSLSAAATSQKHAVARFAGNPGFDPDALINDASIIELKEPVSFDQNGVRPACLPTGPVPRSLKSLIIGGYGIDDFKKQTGAGTLRYTVVSVQPDATCAKDYGKDQFNATSTFCALGKRAGRGTDSCNGDSGSAVMSKTASGVWTLVGIVSYGTDKCATAPGVYSDAFNCGVRASAAAIRRAKLDKRDDPCTRSEKEKTRPAKAGPHHKKPAHNGGKKLGGVETDIVETIRLHGCTQNSECVSNVCKEIEACRGGHTVTAREDEQQEFRNIQRRRAAPARFRAGPVFTSIVQRPVRPVDEAEAAAQQPNTLRQRCSKINVCWLPAWVDAYSSTPTFDFDAIAAEDIDDEHGDKEITHDVAHKETAHNKKP